MKTLDRYLLREFFRIFFLALATLIAFYEMVVFLDYVGYFVKFHATSDMVARFMLFKIPMAVFHVTPICVLLASLLTAAALARSHELTAMKGAGIPLVRIAAPILAAAGGISLLMFLDSEHLFYLAAQETNRIYYEEVKQQPRSSLFTRDRFWYKTADGAVLNIDHVDVRNRKLYGVSIFRFDPARRRVVSRETAALGEAVAGGWRFTGYVERTFAPGGEFSERRVDQIVLDRALIGEEEFTKVALDPEEMNRAQLADYVDDITAKGYDATRYRMEQHAKVAFPLISLVMPLVAFPMGSRSSRSGGMMVAIATALAIGGVFWLMTSLGLSVGRAGKLPPLMAAYGPHLLFASLGLLMLLSDRK